MRSLAEYIFAALLVLMIPGAAFADELGYLRMSHVEGDVQIKIPEGSDWGPAVVNGPLSENDQIWVPRGGRAEIQLPGGAFVRLDGDTALQVLSVGSNATQFHLSQGGAYIYAEASRREAIQIDTPDASVRASNSVVFRVDLTDRATDVGVYKGFVDTENRLGQTRVSAGKMLSLGQETSGSVAPLGPADAWERWNTARNDSARNTAGVSTRYLPEELQGYSRDFDTGGRWVTVPEYGNVWTPTVIVVGEWAPYRHGRWIWRHGHYIWLPYDSWGWVPYHYGRWTHVPRHGWCWVPPVHRQVYWGPGYVGWVRSSSHIGWVPLAPGEIYYGRGYYGPHSVNLTKVNVTQVNVVYKNVTVNHGATVVHRDHFHAHAPKAVVYNRSAHQDLFGRKNVSVGGPDVKQQGQAPHRWSDRRIAPENHPPQTVQRTSVSALKQQRPLVRETDRSVFRRGEPARNLPVTSVTTPSMPRRDIGKNGRKPDDSAPAGSPGFRDPGSDQRRPGASSPAVKPGVPDQRTQPGGDRPRIQQPERNGSAVPGDRRVAPEPSRRPDTPPAASPGVRGSGSDQRRPGDSAPAVKPGVPDQRTQPGGDRPRIQQPGRNGSAVPGDRRQMQAPDAGRQSAPPAAQPEPPRRAPQVEERRDTRPAERPGVGTERRQERTEPFGPRRDDRDDVQQERGRPGGIESQQPGDRGRQRGRDGSFDLNRNRQQTHVAQRAEPSKAVEKMREPQGGKPQQKQEQPAAKQQQARRGEPKNEKQQAKEQRKDGKDSRDLKGNKENRKHEERG